MKNNIIIIVVILIIIGLILAYNSGYIELPKINLNSTLDSSNYCEENIIPERIELTENLNKFYTEVFNGRLVFVEGSHAIGERYTNSQTNWKDGQIIELFNYDDWENKCHKGYLEGENINLVYCNNLKYSSSKTPVSEEGIVGKTTTTSLSINLVLEKEKVEVLSIPPLGLGSVKEVPITTYKVISSDCIIIR